MATDKTKAEKEYTVEEKLKTLYDLQTILSEIDRIKTLRGELPLEVQDLEDEIAGLETRIKNFHTEIEDLKAAVSAKKVEIQNAQTLIEKYTKQQDNVRNNREFDFLSKEIEYQTLEIQLCEKRINEFIAAQEAKSNEVAASEEILQDRQHILNEKKSNPAKKRAEPILDFAAVCKTRNLCLRGRFCAISYMSRKNRSGTHPQRVSAACS